MRVNNLQIKETLDVGFCLDILMNDDIFEAISEDEATIDDLNIDVMKHFWLALTDDDQDIGCVQLIPKTSNSWEAHIHILPIHRKRYSHRAGLEIWHWLRMNLKGNVIYCKVPSNSPNVKKYLEGFKFKQVGLLEKVWLKNGKLLNMWIMSRGID